MPDRKKPGDLVFKPLRVVTKRPEDHEISEVLDLSGSEPSASIEDTQEKLTSLVDFVNEQQDPVVVKKGDKSIVVVVSFELFTHFKELGLEYAKIYNQLVALEAELANRGIRVDYHEQIEPE